MCNLYSLNSDQDTLRGIFGVDVENDHTGNLQSEPSIYPDAPAPVLRMTHDGSRRELLKMRWGFPSPPQSKSKVTTNIRNPSSSWWRPWLKPEYRCLVPVTSFCEYTDSQPKIAHWFAFGQPRPPFAFAGIWRPWTGVRGTKNNTVEGEHLVYAFLTTDANDLVRPIHAKAMPVMLTTPEEFDIWLRAPETEALALQKPFPEGRLEIVASGRGMREDPGAGPVPSVGADLFSARG